jgi:hypothetical protein
MQLSIVGGFTQTILVSPETSDVFTITKGDIPMVVQTLLLGLEDRSLDSIQVEIATGLGQMISE